MQILQIWKFIFIDQGFISGLRPATIAGAQDRNAKKVTSASGVNALD